MASACQSPVGPRATGPLRSPCPIPTAARTDPTAGRGARCSIRISKATSPRCSRSAPTTTSSPVTGVVPPDLEGRPAAQRTEPAAVPRRRGRLPLVRRRRDGPRHLAVRRPGRRLPEPLGADPGAGRQGGHRAAQGPERAHRRAGQHPRHPARRHHPGPGGVRLPPRPLPRPRPGPGPRLRRCPGLAHDRPPQGRPGHRRTGLLRRRRLRPPVPPLPRGRRRRCSSHAPRRSTSPGPR